MLHYKFKTLVDPTGAEVKGSYIIVAVCSYTCRLHVVFFFRDWKQQVLWDHIPESHE